MKKIGNYWLPEDQSEAITAMLKGRTLTDKQRRTLEYYAIEEGIDFDRKHWIWSRNS